MYKKVLGKSVGGTVVAGLVLAVAPIAAAPQIAQMACPYPAGVATSTTLALSAYVAPFGAITHATIKVTASANGTPQGTVRLLLDGTVASSTSLNASGQAVLTVPRTAIARTTHHLLAQYLGECSHNASSSSAKSYTVVKARTRDVNKVLQARKARFRVRVLAATGVTVRGGRVNIIVTKNGHKIRQKIAKVRRGYARVDLRNLRRGHYKLVTKYLGNGNFKVSKKRIKKFRVL
jgi:hypothetical protein